MMDCNTVQAFLDAGGIVAVVFIFAMLEIFRLKNDKTPPP